jgi:hypothetical protein
VLIRWRPAAGFVANLHKRDRGCFSLAVSTNPLSYCICSYLADEQPVQASGYRFGFRLQGLRMGCRVHNGSNQGSEFRVWGQGLGVSV